MDVSGRTYASWKRYESVRVGTAVAGEGTKKTREEITTVPGKFAKARCYERLIACDSFKERHNGTKDYNITKTKSHHENKSMKYYIYSTD